MWAAFSMIVAGALRDYVNPVWFVVGILVLMALQPSRKNEDYRNDDGDKK